MLLLALYLQNTARAAHIWHIFLIFTVVAHVTESSEPPLGYMGAQKQVRKGSMAAETGKRCWRKEKCKGMVFSSAQSQTEVPHSLKSTCLRSEMASSLLAELSLLLVICPFKISSMNISCFICALYLFNSFDFEHHTKSRQPHRVNFNQTHF